MKVAVLGAGSVGCFIGGAWAAAGVDVRLVGRERVRDEIARHGLGLSDSSGWRIELAPDLVDFRTDARAIADAAVIAVTVKSSGSEAAAKEIARHAKRDATVVTFQNGVSNAELLQRLLPKHQVVQGTVAYNVAHLGRGRWHKGTAGDLIAARTPATEALSAAIGNRPGRLLPSDDMAAVAWGKLLINLNNAVNALSGTSLLDQLSQRGFRRVTAAAIQETLELLTAAGITPAKVGPVPPRLLPHVIGSPDFIFNRLFLKVQKIDAKARSSMADDLAAGRATEIDWLNGEVVRLAERLGRAAPVNAAMCVLVKEAEVGIDRGWTAATLSAEVLKHREGVAAFGY